MGHFRHGSTRRTIARRRHAAVIVGALALTIVGASPAAAAGIGERITDWPVATSLAAALIFGVLAIVFASLSRAVRDPDTSERAQSAMNGTGTTSATARPASAPSLDKRSRGDIEPYHRPGVVAKRSQPVVTTAPVEPVANPAPSVAEPVAPIAPVPVAQPVAAAAPVSEPVAPSQPVTNRRPLATDADPLYPLATCRQFAMGLGDEVLERALKLFQPLGQIGRLDSVQLAEMLDARPASLGGLLTTPLSRRADALGLPLPYVIDRVPGTRRRVWRDHAAIADRMAAALREEIALRERIGGRPSPDQMSPNGDSLHSSMVGRS